MIYKTLNVNGQPQVVRFPDGTTPEHIQSVQDKIDAKYYGDTVVDSPPVETDGIAMSAAKGLGAGTMGLGRAINALGEMATRPISDDIANFFDANTKEIERGMQHVAPPVDMNVLDNPSSLADPRFWAYGVPMMATSMVPVIGGTIAAGPAGGFGAAALMEGGNAFADADTQGDPYIEALVKAGAVGAGVGALEMLGAGGVFGKGGLKALQGLGKKNLTGTSLIDDALRKAGNNNLRGAELAEVRKKSGLSIDEFAELQTKREARIPDAEDIAVYTGKQKVIDAAKSIPTAMGIEGGTETGQELLAAAIVNEEVTRQDVGEALGAGALGAATGGGMGTLDAIYRRPVVTEENLITAEEYADNFKKEAISVELEGLTEEQRVYGKDKAVDKVAMQSPAGFFLLHQGGLVGKKMKNGKAVDGKDVTRIYPEVVKAQTGIRGSEAARAVAEAGNKILERRRSQNLPVNPVGAVSTASQTTRDGSQMYQPPTAPPAPDGSIDFVEHRAFHGTPNKIIGGKLSTKYPFTGEGSQYRGAGIYIADRQSVAKSYKRGEKGTILEEISIRGETINVRRGINPDKPQSAIDELDWIIGRLANSTDFKKTIEEVVLDTFIDKGKAEAEAKMLELLKSDGLSVAYDGVSYHDGLIKHEAPYLNDTQMEELLEGRAEALAQYNEVVKLVEGLEDGEIDLAFNELDPKLFEIEADITDDQYLFLDFPVMESASRNILLNDNLIRSIMYDPSSFQPPERITGWDLYEDLAEHLGSEPEASKYLLSIGIKGNKFLDGYSRKKLGKVGFDSEKASYNYVIFDEDALTITDTFEQQEIDFAVAHPNNHHRNTRAWEVRDAVYEKKLDTDPQMARRMLDTAARNAGYTPKTLYHRTHFNKKDNFTVFKTTENFLNDTWYQGAWFTDDREYPESIGRQGAEYKVYLKSEALLDMTGLGEHPTAQEVQSFYDRHGINASPAHDWSEQGIPAYDEPKGSNLEAFAKAGYDMVMVSEADGATSFVVLNPNQIKSADLATYDDNGNLIPLSQRFDSGSNDIRYQEEIDTAPATPPVKIERTGEELSVSKETMDAIQAELESDMMESKRRSQYEDLQDAAAVGAAPSDDMTGAQLFQFHHEQATRAQNMAYGEDKGGEIAMSVDGTAKIVEDYGNPFWNWWHGKNRKDINTRYTNWKRARQAALGSNKGIDLKEPLPPTPEPDLSLMPRNYQIQEDQDWLKSEDRRGYALLSEERSGKGKRPISKQDLKNEIEAATGVPIRMEKFNQNRKGKTVLGWYKTSDQLIKIRNLTKVGTLFHEIGHWVGGSIFGTEDFLANIRTMDADNIPKIYSDILAPELRRLDYDGRLQRPYEGFAEWFRMYMMGVDMSEVAPNFTAYWEKQIMTDPNLTRVTDAVRRIKKMADEYNMQGALGRFNAEIGYKQRYNKSATLKNKVNKGVKLLHTWLVDSNRFTDMEKQLKIDRILAPSKSPSQLYTFYKEKSPAYVYQAIYAQPIDLNGVAIKQIETPQSRADRVLAVMQGVTPPEPQFVELKNLQEIIDPLAEDIQNWRKGKTDISVISWMTAHRANIQHGRDIVTPFRQADIDAVLNKFEELPLETQAQYRKFSSELKAWMGFFKNMLVEAGGLSEVESLVLDETYGNFYIPFYTTFEEGGMFLSHHTKKNLIRGGKKGMDHVRKGFHRTKGNDRPIENPLESLEQYAQEIVARSMKLKITRSIADLYKEYSGFTGTPMGRYITEIDPPLEKSSVTISQAISAMRKNGVAVNTKGIPKDTLRKVIDILHPPDNWSNVGDDNVVSFVTQGADGKDIRKYFKIMDEGLWQSLTEQNGWSDVTRNTAFDLFFGKPARTVRLGATGINPAFALKNLIRDTIYVMAVSTHLSGFQRVTYPVHMLNNWRKIMQHKLGYGSEDTKYIELYMSMGGEHVGQIGLDRLSIENSMDKLLAHGLNTTEKVKNFAKPRNTIDFIRMIIGTTEMANRIGEFEAAMKQIDKQNAADPHNVIPKTDQHIIAFNAAQDLLNFTRAGTLGREANKGIPFLNAKIQGIDKLYRKATASRADFLQLVGTGASMTAFTMFLWALNKEDDWYKELGAEERATHWHYKSGDTVYRIPKPFELGYMFASLPESMLMAMEYNEPERAAEMAHAIRKGMDVEYDFWFPVLLEVARSWWANENYMKMPIVTKDLEKKLPEDQFKRWTPSIYRHIGEMTGLSPLKLEYAASQLTGGMSRRFAKGAVLFKGVDKNSVDPWQAEIPILSSFVLRDPRRPTRSLKQFYSRLDHLRKMKASDKLTTPELKWEFTYLDAQSRAINKVNNHLKYYEEQGDVVAYDQAMRYKAELLREATGNAKEVHKQVQRPSEG